MLPYAERNGLVVLAYGALCRGLLTGKITAKTEFKGDDLRKVDPNSSNRGSDTILRPSPASMPSHASGTGRRCLRSPFAGCSIAARSSRFGVLAARISSRRSRM